MIRWLVLYQTADHARQSSTVGTRACPCPCSLTDTKATRTVCLPVSLRIKIALHDPLVGLIPNCGSCETIFHRRDTGLSLSMLAYGYEAYQDSLLARLPTNKDCPFDGSTLETRRCRRGCLRRRASGRRERSQKRRSEKDRALRARVAKML